jgi:hypothetical protein
MMSRGLGRVQRAILDYLATDPSGRWDTSGFPIPTTVYRVTCAVFGVSQPTDSQRASVRRAARQLHRAGLIRLQERTVWGELNRRTYLRRKAYSEPGRELEKVPVSQMSVSRLPTPEEAAKQEDVNRRIMQYLRSSALWGRSKL